MGKFNEPWCYRFRIIVDGAVIIVEGIVFEIERRISRQKAVLNRAEMDKNQL